MTTNHDEMAPRKKEPKSQEAESQEGESQFILQLKEKFDLYMSYREPKYKNGTLDARRRITDADGIKTSEVDYLYQQAIQFHDKPHLIEDIGAIAHIDDLLKEDDRSEADKERLKKQRDKLIKLTSVTSTNSKCLLLFQRLKHACKTVSEVEGTCFDIAWFGGQLQLFVGTHWMADELDTDLEKEFYLFLLNDVGPTIGVELNNINQVSANAYLKRSTENALAKFTGEGYNINSGLVAFKDGTYNFKRGKFKPSHDPNDMVVTYVPIDYNSLKDVPAYCDDKLLKYINKETDGLKFSMRMFKDVACFRALCENLTLGLSRTKESAKTTLIKGVSNSGKSRLLEAIYGWVPELCHEVEAELLFHKTGYTRGGQLKGAGNACWLFSYETPRSKLHANSFKSMTRMENLKREYKGKDPVNHRANFRVFTCSNHNLDFGESGTQVDDRLLTIPVIKGYKDEYKIKNMDQFLKRDRVEGLKIIIAVGKRIFDNDYNFTESKHIDEASEQIGNATKRLVTELDITIAHGRPNQHITKELLSAINKVFHKENNLRELKSVDDLINEIGMTLGNDNLRGDRSSRLRFKDVKHATRGYLKINIGNQDKFEQLFRLAVSVAKRDAGETDKTDSYGNIKEVDIWKHFKFPKLFDLHKTGEQDVTDDGTIEDTSQLDAFGKGDVDNTDNPF